MNSGEAEATNELVSSGESTDTGSATPDSGEGTVAEAAPAPAASTETGASPELVDALNDATSGSDSNT